MESSETPPPSLRQGVRVVPPESSVTVEEVLLAVGERVGHENLSFASRMNGAVVAFLKDELLVRRLVGSGVVIRGVAVQVSPLSAPSTRITVSGVPPFIPNEDILSELRRFGKFASGLKAVNLGCRDVKLRHVQSLRRQVFMFLNSPAQSLDVSFRVKHGDGAYILYASSDQLRCFQCGEVGHKRAGCARRKRDGAPAGGAPAGGAPAGGAPTGGAPAGGAPAEEPRAEVKEPEGRDPQDNQRAQGGTGGVQKVGQVEVVGSQEGVGDVQQEEVGKQVEARGQEEPGGVQKVGQVEVVGSQEGVGDVQQEEVGKQVEDRGQEEPGELQVDGAQQVDVAQRGDKGGQRKVGEDDVGVGGSEADMEAEEEGPRGGRLKRKHREVAGSSQTKTGAGGSGRDEGGTGGDESSEEDSTEMDSEPERPGRKTYSLERIKKFLKDTKGMRRVKLEEYFSDKEGVGESARALMRSKDRGGFTEQEKYRVKKLVRRIVLEVFDEDLLKERQAQDKAIRR